MVKLKPQLANKKLPSVIKNAPLYNGTFAPRRSYSRPKYGFKSPATILPGSKTSPPIKDVCLLTI